MVIKPTNSTLVDTAGTVATTGLGALVGLSAGGPVRTVIGSAVGAISFPILKTINDALPQNLKDNYIYTKDNAVACLTGFEVGAIMMRAGYGSLLAGPAAVAVPAAWGLAKYVANNEDVQNTIKFKYLKPYYSLPELVKIGTIGGMAYGYGAAAAAIGAKTFGVVKGAFIGGGAGAALVAAKYEWDQISQEFKNEYVYTYPTTLGAAVGVFEAGKYIAIHGFAMATPALIVVGSAAVGLDAKYAWNNYIPQEFKNEYVYTNSTYLGTAVGVFEASQYIAINSLAMAAPVAIIASGAALGIGAKYAWDHTPESFKQHIEQVEPYVTTPWTALDTSVGVLNALQHLYNNAGIIKNSFTPALAQAAQHAKLVDANQGTLLALNTVTQLANDIANAAVNVANVIANPGHPAAADGALNAVAAFAHNAQVNSAAALGNRASTVLADAADMSSKAAARAIQDAAQALTAHRADNAALNALAAASGHAEGHLHRVLAENVNIGADIAAHPVVGGHSAFLKAAVKPVALNLAKGVATGITTSYVWENTPQEIKDDYAKSPFTVAGGVIAAMGAGILPAQIAVGGASLAIGYAAKEAVKHDYIQDDLGAQAGMKAGAPIAGYYLKGHHNNLGHAGLFAVIFAVSTAAGAGIKMVYDQYAPQELKDAVNDGYTWYNTNMDSLYNYASAQYSATKDTVFSFVATQYHNVVDNISLQAITDSISSAFASLSTQQETTEPNTAQLITNALSASAAVVPALHGGSIQQDCAFIVSKESRIQDQHIVAAGNKILKLSPHSDLTIKNSNIMLREIDINPSGEFYCQNSKITAIDRILLPAQEHVHIEYCTLVGQISYSDVHHFTVNSCTGGAIA